MKQNDINRQVAHCTGEAVAEIAARGFSLADVIAPDSDYPGIDWDELQLERNVQLVRHNRPTAA